MAKEIERRSWRLDQFAKSVFFHQKLHEWGLLEVFSRLENAPAAQWDWTLEPLGISEAAWETVIHSPRLTPVLVFAHPQALQTIPGAVRYYRMVAMLSQKSMQRVGLSVTRFEERGALPAEPVARQLARHFNRVISALVADDAHQAMLSRDEIFLWRGMAAGAQAQGSWQNSKGARVENLVRQRLGNHLRREGALPLVAEEGWQWEAYTIRFASEPDIAVWSGNEIVAAVEIKGGIDAAGVLERLGAAVKSLQRVKDEFPAAVTVLVLTGASLTPQAEDDLHRQRQAVNAWYLLEDLLEIPDRWEDFLTKIRLTR